ncbi:MAG: response regulator [Proteobacteria bacterium]|nr:response regulator [Pseudomonadota bacterium]
MNKPKHKDMLSILVVDDNNINRAFFNAALSKSGFHVQLASDGLFALKLCQNNIFDLILMDIRMDGLDGIATTLEIQKLEAYKNTIIIAVSAETISQHELELFSDFLLKPIKKSLLIDTIKSHTNRLNLIVDKEKALTSAYHDQEIVNKLQKMLCLEIPKDLEKIQTLLKNNSSDSLQLHLHTMLGSAKVCAATSYEGSIRDLKSGLNKRITEQKTAKLLEKLIDDGQEFIDYCKQ